MWNAQVSAFRAIDEYDILTVLEARFHEGHESLVDQTIMIDGDNVLQLESAILSDRKSITKVVRTFLDTVRTNLTRLGADGWVNGQLLFILPDGRQIYKASKTRRGVKVVRYFQCSNQHGANLQVMIDHAGAGSAAITRLVTERKQIYVTSVVPDVPAGWTGSWRHFANEPTQAAVEARYPPQTDAHRNSLLKLQKDGLEQLIILPPEIRQRAFSQLLEHYRYVVDLRARSSSLSPPKLRGRLASHTENTFCGPSLLSDNQLLEEFAEAELQARRKCTPLLLLDADTVLGRSALDDTPAQSASDELFLEHGPLPEVEEIHVGVMLQGSDPRNVAEKIRPTLDKFLRLTPNATKINLRIFLQIADFRTRPGLTGVVAGWRWAEMLGLPQASTLNVEAYEFQSYSLPGVGGAVAGTRHVLAHMYPSTSPEHASHMFWGSDYLALVDCAMGRPMPRDVLEPLEHSCSIVAGQHEQCSCQAQPESTNTAEGRLIEV
ncbi:hypothetical protein KVT40_006515 [Elsinoe batatas]|uniref:Uncharacterized protein n=1 Tax=Elsinoe batatas TaxID=2601811 RepID=A0A8K0PHZ5_9PEZI|nr:hypothetical protein KVT40_006515 [Elsinoe batatas]